MLSLDCERLNAWVHGKIQMGLPVMEFTKSFLMEGSTMPHGTMTTERPNPGEEGATGEPEEEQGDNSGEDEEEASSSGDGEEEEESSGE